jgi:hypothetical protein
MPKGEKKKRHFQYTEMTSDLSYIVGVYMGDGSVYISMEGYGYFTHGSVDMDFLEKVANCANVIFGQKPKIKFLRKAPNANSRDMFGLHVCCTQFALWLRETTGNKGFIPKSISSGSLEIRIAFLQGLMDSEGYISERTTKENGRTNTPSMNFSVKSEWIFDVRAMMIEIGIGVADITTSSGQYRYLIDPRSYMQNGLTFTIRRKRERLERALLPHESKSRVKSKRHNKPGFRPHNAKLSVDQVALVRQMSRDGQRNCQISLSLGIPRETVSKILRGIIYCQEASRCPEGQRQNNY